MKYVRKCLKLVFVLLALMLVMLLGLRLAAVVRETKTADQAAPASGRFVATKQGRIFVTETGPPDGMPIVLVHGSGAWGGLWQETADRLARHGYRSIAIDLPPFGFSDRPLSRDYSRVAQAGRIVALVEAMRLPPVTIVGHSFGGGPAIEAVMRAPQLFDKAVLVDPALGIDTPVRALALPLRSQPVREIAMSAVVTNPLLTRTMLASLLYRKDRAAEPYITIVQQPLGRSETTTEVAAWLPFLMQADHHALSGQASSYRTLGVPLSVIWGDRDSVTPLDQLQRLRRASATVKIEVLKDVGHIPQVEDPAAFQAALLRLLTKAVKLPH